MPDITNLIKIHASPERVYQALTTAEGIRNWLTRDAVLDSQVGGTGEFGFTQERRYVMEVRVDDLQPTVRAGWKVISARLPEWAGTTIAFDLQAEGSETVLSFAHRGFARADEAYAMTSTAWEHFLASLQQYLETGKGTPADADSSIVTK